MTSKTAKQVRADDEIMAARKAELSRRRALQASQEAAEAKAKETRYWERAGVLAAEWAAIRERDDLEKKAAMTMLEKRHTAEEEEVAAWEAHVEASRKAGNAKRAWEAANEEVRRLQGG